MLELRGISELEANLKRIEDLPIEVQQYIIRVLTILDESYNIPGRRAFEGGKVIVLEDESEVVELCTCYDISDNEFIDKIVTTEGNYLYILVIQGSENNLAIFLTEKWGALFLKQ